MALPDHPKEATIMPWNKTRTWKITDAESAEALAKDLTEYGWTLCTGFRLEGYLFCNDSLSEDSVQEYVVIREADMAEVESITFGWCDEAKALDYIRQITTDPTPFVYSHAERGHIETVKEHGTCWACA